MQGTPFSDSTDCTRGTLPASGFVHRSFNGNALDVIGYRRLCDRAVCFDIRIPDSAAPEGRPSLATFRTNLGKIDGSLALKSAAPPRSSYSRAQGNFVSGPPLNL